MLVQSIYTDGKTRVDRKCKVIVWVLKLELELAMDLEYLVVTPWP